MGYQIAIDGPAGAGKSTIARLLAARLGFTYMDTGAMYRAMGLFFTNSGKWPETDEEIEKLCASADIAIKFMDGEQHVFLNGKDVSKEIRLEQAGIAASKVSTLGPVRKRLVELQQKLSAQSDVVMDGRDIGTVVLPEANLKIYLGADVGVRALRRYKELKTKGIEADLSEIERDVAARDHQDMTRDISPLKQAEDAFYVDSSELSIEQVIAEILKLKEEKDRCR